LLDYPNHRGLQRWVRDLNAFYRRHPAWHEVDYEPGGFEWIDCTDTQNVVFGFIRHGREGTDPVVVVANLTPLPRAEYRLGVPGGIERWRLALNSDATDYWGSGYP